MSFFARMEELDFSMDLSVITVTWNNAKTIGDQIRSVQAGCEGILYEQIIVDNASSDHTPEIVRKNFPEIQYIQNTKNKGFAAANNAAAAVAKGRYLLFLNPDMRIEQGSLGVLMQWMDAHEDVGIVSCKLVDETGQFNTNAGPRRFPRLRDQLALILKLPHIFPHVLDSYLMHDFDEEKEQEVDSVRGSFLLMRRTLIETLGWAFDPRYFIWFEDVDVCKEAQKHGFKVMYTPLVSCIDLVGQSFAQRPSLWKQQQFTKSKLFYFKKWEPWYVWMWIAVARPIGIFLVRMNEKLAQTKK